MSLKETLLYNKVIPHDLLTNTEANKETRHSTSRFVVTVPDKTACAVSLMSYKLSPTCGPTQGPQYLLGSSCTGAVHRQLRAMS